MRKFLSSFILTCLIIGALVGCSAKNDMQEDSNLALQNETQKLTQDIEQEEETVEPQTESRGIIGSHYIDVRLGLEQRGFPKKSLDESESMQCKTYENTMEGVVQYNCSLFIEQDDTIMSANFDILNLELIETEDFIKYATSYLKYCASMPYDTMDVDKVYNWIDENIEEVGSGDEGVSIIIGDAEFSLYGTEVSSGIAGTRLLEIRNAVNDK